MTEDTVGHKYARLILGFLLTVSIGAGLNYLVQTRADKRATIESRRATLLAVGESASTLLNRVYYYYSRMYDVATNPEALDVARATREFDDIKAEHESQWYSLAGSVCAHFGSDVGDRFINLNEMFQRLDSPLRAAVKSGSIQGLSPIYDYRDSVFVFTMSIAANIDATAVKSVEETELCDERAFREGTAAGPPA